MRGTANLNKQNFHNFLLSPEGMSFTELGNPVIAPVEPEQIPEGSPWVAFNYLTGGKYIHTVTHFFIQDYMFDRVWNAPGNYLEILRQQDAVIGPDFSTFRDTPEPIQRWSHYRRQWLSAYWQLNGITVIPNVRWSTEKSFDWCFDGVPENSVVCVSAVGCLADTEARQIFFRGYIEMQKRLKPSLILLRCAPKSFQSIKDVTKYPTIFIDGSFRNFISR